MVAFTKKCLQLNTLVPKRVTRQLSTPEMDLFNFGLGDLGALALAEALKVGFACALSWTSLRLRTVTALRCS